MIKKIIKFFNGKMFHFFYSLKTSRVFAFPKSIRLETSTICNLKCPCCPTGRGENRMSKGFLKFSDFKKFIDKYGFLIEDIYLSNKGEMFLNPEIFEIIKYAEDRGIKTHADSNLNYFNEKMAKKLIDSGMSELTVAIDGISQKDYSVYRVNGNFDKVISNINLINKAKKKNSSNKPYLSWQFIIFGHNEKNIEKAKKMAEDLNMSFILKPSWNDKFSPPSNLNEIKKRWGIYERDGSFCDDLWICPTINYNGDLFGCCVFCDEEYNLGNVFKKSFFKAYNGKKMRKVRKYVLGKLKEDDSIFCPKCEFLKNPLQSNSRIKTLFGLN